MKCHVCRRRIEDEERDRERKRVEKVRRREERRTDREERRRLQKLAAKRREDEQKMQQRIAVEERKILIAQRKLETIRLLSELFARIKVTLLRSFQNPCFSAEKPNLMGFIGFWVVWVESVLESPRVTPVSESCGKSWSLEFKCSVLGQSWNQS